MNDFSKRRWKWMLIGLTLLRLIVNFGAVDLWAAETDRIEMDLTRKKRELKKIRKELYQKKAREKEIRRKESSILNRLEGVTAKLHQKENELKRMKAKAGGIKRRLEQTRNEIGMLNKEMEETKKKLISRLNALYKMERAPSELFLSLSASESYSDLLKMDKYLRGIIDSDARLMDTFQHQVTLREAYEEDLIQDETQWLHSIAKVEEKKEEIKKFRKENRLLLEAIQDQREVYQKDIGKLEDRARGLQALIDQLGKMKHRLVYKRPGGKIIRGKLLSPVQGRVISGFKEGGQNGVEIKAPLGTEIRAVLPGRILFADWFKGFGNVVIIDHGNHFFTVSAYCSQLLKKAGENVSQGEPIARVGSEDSSKDSSLYFEIRLRGKPQDPMEWVSNLRKE
jgi:septal ring factor EnvC (AmiA/AmiB activator)